MNRQPAETSATFSAWCRDVHRHAWLMSMTDHFFSTPHLFSLFERGFDARNAASELLRMRNGF